MSAKPQPPNAGLPDRTDLMLPLDAGAERQARLLHDVRAATFRVRADCERMLEDLRGGEQDAWRSMVTEAYVASRELTALTSHVLRGSGDRNADEWTNLATRLQGPQRRLLEAMRRLLRLVPTGVDEELLHDDARAIHDRAATLLHVGAPETPAVAANGAHAKARVLVVEDERLLREMLRRFLVGMDFEVLQAEDGSSGLETAERQRPDLILTDVNMPGVDGMEFLRLIKANDTLREIPVIVISGQDDVESVARCIELGAEDHIAKPFEPTLLNARISASLLRRRARQQELDYLRRVSALTTAAEAVERDVYVPGSVLTPSAPEDELAMLARVFDRVVTGMKSREAQLKRRLARLRLEVQGTGSGSAAVAMSEESPFASGEILAARYEILGQLGNGGMGMVYHARDLELGEDVAVKVVRKDLIVEDPTIVDRLKSEIRLARRITHRNVVRVFDLGDWKGVYFISMEFVRGVTLEDLLDKRGRLTVESTLAIGSQLAEALAVAHEQQIIHRDIKPGNLLLDESGTLKVMDFGIARSIERDAASITASGFIVGTPHYMAPEQLCGRAVDGRTDLFAVGVVLYECLTGTLPFSGDSPVELNERIESSTFQALRDRRPEVPTRLEELVHQQFQPRPANRARSARELAERLAEIEHGRG